MTKQMNWLSGGTLCTPTTSLPGPRPPILAIGPLLSPNVPRKPEASRILLLDEEEVSCLKAPLFSTPSTGTLSPDAWSIACSHNETDHESTPSGSLPILAITPSPRYGRYWALSQCPIHTDHHHCTCVPANSLTQRRASPRGSGPIY